MATQIYWNQEAYHYGMPRRSGRYKWGTGEDPYHHGADLPRGFKKTTRLERATKKKNIGTKTKRLITTQKKEYEKDPDAFRKKYYGDNATNKKIERDFIKRREYADKYTKRAEKKEQNLKDKLNIKEPLKKPTKTEREEILNSGDATKVMKYKQFFSNEELQRAKTRLVLENDIGKISNEQIQNGSKKLSKMSKTLDTYTSSIETLGNSYNRIAKIYNAFSDKNSPKLPIINGGKNNNTKAKEDSANVNGKHYSDKPIKNGKNKKSGSVRNLREENNDAQKKGSSTKKSTRRSENNAGYSVSNAVPKINRIPSNLNTMASNTTSYRRRGYRVIPTSGPSTYEGVVRKEYRTPRKWRKR